MRRLAVVLAVLLAPLVSAQQKLAVRITSPLPGMAAYGMVTVSAVVAADEPVARVTFAVDGRPFGDVTRPPYEATTDVGADNIEHRFVVTATTASGRTAESLLFTPAIESNADVTVELRQIYAVVARGDRRVPDLAKEHFTVYDNGVPQQIVTFAGGDVAFTATILVDASDSMVGQPLAQALAGAKAFLSGMKPLDEGRLIVFSDHLVHVTPFTNVPEVLFAGLGGVKVHGGTSLNDTLLLALEQLDERQGRRVVVLLSDGIDTHSALSIDAVMHKAHESQALIYWIRLYDSDSCGQSPAEKGMVSAWREAIPFRDQVRGLERAVRESGGTTVQVCSPSQIAPAFSAILQELREQYAIGYYPSERKGNGSWHEVRIKVGQDGAEVKTRDGYVDD